LVHIRVFIEGLVIYQSKALKREYGRLVSPV